MPPTYIAYGIGQYYNIIKPELDKASIHISYVCDRKWEGTGRDSYEGIPVISKADIRNISNAVCVIFTMDHIITNSIKKDLEALGVTYMHVDALLGDVAPKLISGAELKKAYQDGHYSDVRGNEIFYDETVPDNLRITFRGGGNVLRLGHNLLIGQLDIVFGNDGECAIGDNTEVLKGYFQVAYAKLQVGENCLVATDVIIRTHDGHYIFDKTTKERINRPRNVIVGKHVWLAKGVVLLAGAQIGDGCVVGANSVTSGTFPEDVVIAGSPAKVIRENICWSREETGLSDYNTLDECCVPNLYV